MSNNITKQAIILAAGLGTRLRPLTNEIPKPMLPILEGKPLLEHTLCLLRDQGFEKFIINLHYLPEKIVSYFGDGSRFGVDITYSDETNGLMDTAGALKKVERAMEHTFALLYGDMLHSFDFEPVVALHHENRALATVVLKRSGNPQNGEVAKYDFFSSRITHWYGRPHNIYELDNELFCNSGLYVLSKEILASLTPGKPVNLDAEVIPQFVKDYAPVYGFPTSQTILDIGSQEEYELAKRCYAELAAIAR